MKRILMLLAAQAILVAPAAAQTQTQARRARVDSLLARMTLEEKVGQMTQLTLSAFTAPGTPHRDSVRLDVARLREGIVNRHIGSILNVEQGALTVEGWHDAVRRIQRVAMLETRLGIPILYGIDFVHGANYTRGGTLFPQNIAIAATFDTALARRAGEITGDEAYASALPWNFAPVLDVGRQPLWPRFYETFGEDPWLASLMGRSQVAGMQRGGRVAATMKHYLGYSNPRSGHDRTPAYMTVREVRESYLPPFAAAVRAGARAVMVNSGEIDGEPLHASRYWLTDVLRGELGFDGVIVTDWADIIYLNTRHHVAPTLKDAVRMAVQAGVDVSMTPNDYQFYDDLIALVREGTIPESRIDQSVRRILTLKADLGLFEAPFPDETAAHRVGGEASAAVSRQAAREAITLLKNEGGVLPLRKAARILVTGPAAQSLTALNGGWTYTWQGSDASQFPAGPRTLLEAMLKRGRDVRYVPGAAFADTMDIAAAARAARDADVAVVAVGEDAYAETPGNIDDLTLPEPQLRLVEAIEATGTPVVLVLVEGRPRVITRVAGGARAIVMAYWPGMHGGEALADVLFGDANPSGRLPFTYPRAVNQLVPYDHKRTDEIGPAAANAFHPLFEFGSGLGYTTFAYSGLKTGAATLRPGGTLPVTVTVRNTGGREGTETVLFFTRQRFASLSPAVRRLRGFQRITLQPGEARTVTFTLSADDLTYVGRDGRPVLEAGTFDVMVGGLTASFTVATGATDATGAAASTGGGTTR
ncbi:glycoside hydrolase family 3 N-terminal domain-containing protein [Longimicrobium sp.]|uniref:glycoside hydrolase family 3 N-terminal domain-containing protein n=1 Tax=Longimicrobium sp. TaxID=2029185 RepID=UPI002C946763|nr:glycoside hydrolase family 3 N-terminal domain-containing protein [Longimicrobium sp.]HSU17721.1 glycoside hydrolase family 3 N-terminal domain-containing protein [Longimicrobium sp.]